MKKLFLLLLIVPVLVVGQGVQRYADGTATDQDGNTFDWINYGTQDWAIENAEVVTYRDGTVITEVTYQAVWSNLTTGAWCYYDNDPSKGKLYNWYAVAGIHNESSINNPSLRKEFAPEGWRVPTDAEWTTLENYLIANGYNYDGTTTENKIVKSVASTTGWNISTTIGATGNDQSKNNRSGFNAFPEGMRADNGVFYNEYFNALIWSSTESSTDKALSRNLRNSSSFIDSFDGNKRNGIAVRFVRDAATASIDKYSNTITIYPNPTTSIVTLQGGKQYDIEVYDMAGNKVMALTGNNINMEHLSTAT